MRTALCLSALLLGLASAHAQPGPADAAAPESAPTRPAKAAPALEPTGPVTLSFGTRGPSATVYYGKRQLGTTPFQLKWKRDSGPLDLVFRAAGHFPVYTRIHTVDDEKLIVELTPRNKAHTLFGYKAPIKKAEEPAEILEDDPDLEGRPATPTAGPKTPLSAPARPASRPASAAPGLAPVAPRPPRELRPVAPVTP